MGNGTGNSVKGEIILHNASTARWLYFKNPHRIIEAQQIEEVLPALRKAETLVNNNQWHAAGFISYEAARAFDAALSTRPAGDFPLLWFGFYPEPEQIELPDPDFNAYSMGETAYSVSVPEYERAIRTNQGIHHSGDTYQVNYTLRLRIPFSGDPWHFFLAMVRAQSPGYAAWVDTGRYAICSASPELFFHLEGNRLTCKPMKGTVKRGRTSLEDRSLADWLHLSEKNRAENLMIVDMIRNDLGRVADAGTVRVPRMFEIERHPTLWQMTSTVTAECANSITEIVCALFPCASITGAPKIRTSQIIAELETTSRGLYTGGIGFIAPGRSAQFNVAIRTAILDRSVGQVEYGTGGGIVWDSASGDEHKEALLKARILTERRADFIASRNHIVDAGGGLFSAGLSFAPAGRLCRLFRLPVGSRTNKKPTARSGLRFRPHLAEGPAVAVKGWILRNPGCSADQDFSSPVRVRLAQEPVNSADIFLYHKTTRRGVYEEAMRTVPDCDDVLLWNERRELTESCVANIVVEIGWKAVDSACGFWIAGWSLPRIIA